MPAKGLLKRPLQTGLSSATFLLLLMDQHETGTARGLEFIAEIISGWEFWCPILHIMYNLDELVPRVPRAVICQEGKCRPHHSSSSVNLPNGGAPAYVNWARETATIRTVKFPRCLRAVHLSVLPRRRNRGLGKNPNIWAIRAIYPPLEVRRLK